MSFVKVPNLPENEVKSLILGKKYSNILENILSSRHIISIFTPDNPCVDPRMAGHCDLSVLHLGNNKLLIANFLENSTFFDVILNMNAKVTVSHHTQGVDYPQDANLNVCLIGKRLIYNSKTADGNIDNLITNAVANKLVCRQGYTRCAVSVVDENSIITADNGIADIACSAGMDVLLIKPDLVSLDGFRCGFIGGASFKLSANKIAFTGRINDYYERARIENFLSVRNVIPIYLTDKGIFDIGGAIPLTE